MANTTASTLIDKCLDNISRSSAATTRSGTTLESKGIDWLNTAMIRLSKAHDFREMFKIYERATVSDTKTYTFPTNWKVVLSLRLEDGSSSRKLGVRLPQELDEHRPMPENDSNETPIVYVPYGNTFELDPIPNDAYTLKLRTIQWPTKITATTDTIDYEPNKDDVIHAYMMEEAFDYLQMLTDAEKWVERRKNRLEEAIDLEERLPDLEPIAEGFSSVKGEHYAEDQYDTTTGEWIVNPFLRRKV